MGEIVSWEAVFFEEDNVVLDLGASMEVAHHGVGPGAGLWVGFKANGERSGTGGEAGFKKF